MGDFHGSAGGGAGGGGGGVVWSDRGDDGDVEMSGESQYPGA